MAERSSKTSELHRWIVEHDERKLFIVSYVGLAVVLSIVLSLFWLVALVVVHFAFELVRQADAQETSLISTPSALRALWEVKLDIGLVLFALALALYMEVVLGVLGLGAAGRVGIQAGARFSGWQNVIRGILLSVDDAAQLARSKIAAKNRTGATEGINSEPMKLEQADSELTESALSESDPKESGQPSTTNFEQSLQSDHGNRVTKGDIASLAFGAVFFILILSAPLFVDLTYAEVFSALAAELHPFP